MFVYSFGNSDSSIMNPVIGDDKNIWILTRTDASKPITTDSFLTGEKRDIRFLGKLFVDNDFIILKRPIKYTLNAELIRIIKEKQAQLYEKARKKKKSKNSEIEIDFDKNLVIIE